MAKSLWRISVHLIFSTKFQEEHWDFIRKYQMHYDERCISGDRRSTALRRPFRAFLALLRLIPGFHPGLCCAALSGLFSRCCA